MRTGDLPGRARSVVAEMGMSSSGVLSGKGSCPVIPLVPSPLVPSEPVLKLAPSPVLIPPRSAGERRVVLAAPAGPSAPAQARRLVSDAWRLWRLPGQVEAAALVTASELVTNAVVHAGTPFQMHLWWRGNLLHVAVHDQDSGFVPSWWDRAPERDPGTGDAAARYGLSLVRGLSVECGGYEHPDGGKVMWAVLETGEESGSPGAPDLRTGVVELRAASEAGVAAGHQADQVADSVHAFQSGPPHRPFPPNSSAFAGVRGGGPDPTSGWSGV